MGSFDRVSTCPVCGARLGRVVYEGIGDPLGRGAEYRLTRCDACSHVVTDPIPSRDTISDYYPSTYYAYVEPTEERWSGRVKRWLFRPANDAVGRVVRHVVGKHVAVLPDRGHQGNLLDMGCGNGAFLSSMKRVGWTTYGTEISPQAVEFARRNGHQVSCGDVRDAGFPKDFFDLITVNNVLEHVYDPLEALRELHRVLKPDGELIVCVPNFDCYERRLFGKQWDPLKIPVHFHHFNGHSLTRALVSANFAPYLVKRPIRVRIAAHLKGLRRAGLTPVELLRVYMGSAALAAVYPVLGALSLVLEVPKAGMFLTIHARKGSAA